MAHGDAREDKWRGNWRIEWADSILHTTYGHGVFSITTADVHTSAASSRLNWRPRRFKWTRPFRRKTKSGFCACAITFQTQYTYAHCSSACGTSGVVSLVFTLVRVILRLLDSRITQIIVRQGTFCDRWLSLRGHYAATGNKLDGPKNVWCTRASGNKAFFTQI